MKIKDWLGKHIVHMIVGIPIAAIIVYAGLLLLKGLSMV